MNDVSAAWIGSDVRAITISHRTLGAAGARAVAARGSVSDALTLLSTSPYKRDIRPGQTLESAQHAIAATTLWNTRVLAGWVPATGIAMMRVLVGWYEIANIEAQLRNAFATPPQPFFRLGALAVGWTKLAAASSVTDLCERLATTPWGRPEDASPRTIELTLRTSLLQRAASALPAGRDWIVAAAALLLARERARESTSLPDRAARALAALLGEDALHALTLPDLLSSLPRAARWPFVDVTSMEELWRAEIRWWSRVDADGRTLLRTANFGPLPVVGATAVLSADAWRVRAALTPSAHGTPGLEEFDALA